MNFASPGCKWIGLCQTPDVTDSASPGCKWIGLCHTPDVTGSASPGCNWVGLCQIWAFVNSAVSDFRRGGKKRILREKKDIEKEIDKNENKKKNRQKEKEKEKEIQRKRKINRQRKRQKDQTKFSGFSIFSNTSKNWKKKKNSKERKETSNGQWYPPVHLYFMVILCRAAAPKQQMVVSVCSSVHLFHPLKPWKGSLIFFHGSPGLLRASF